MIGTIGTAPNVDEVSSVILGNRGGNMDCPDIGIGSTLYLSVFSAGG